MKKIDIVIPCHNCEFSIERTVDSIFKNKCFDGMVYLIENGSKDNTLKKITKLSENNSRIHIEDIGKANGNIARNKGLYLSSSDYIIFLDSDDEITSDRVLSDLLIINKNNADIIVNDYRKINLNGNQYTIKTKSLSNNIKYLRLLANKGISITSAITYKRDKLLELNGWNDSQLSSQETELMYRLLINNSKLVVTNKVLANIYETKNSVTKSNTINLRLRNIDIRMDIFDYLANKNEKKGLILWYVIKRLLLIYEVDHLGYSDFILSDRFRFFKSRRNNLEKIALKIFNSKLVLSLFYSYRKNV